jgi:arylsulfatase A-like enzyme
MKRIIIKGLIAVIFPALLIVAGSPLFGQAKHKKPNVVFILADDLGWRDVGYMGTSFYQTPNIDALAKRGMVFTNAYSASPLCSASRGSIMTGLYPAKTGIIDAGCHVPQVRLYASVREQAPPALKVLAVESATRLKVDYYTLGEAFKDAGYITAHIGKWHIGTAPFDPQHQGFDIDIPHTGESGPTPNGWFAPWPVWPGHGQPGENLEDAMANEAVKFIKSHKDKPFLLDYWSFSVHAPWDAKQNLIDKYARLANPDNPQHNPVYAGMIETLDDAVGKIVGALKKEGMLDNTIIVFCSDNGGVHWGEQTYIPDPYKGVPITSNAPLRAGKATDYNGGVRVPLAVIWPGHIQPGTVNEKAVVSGVDIYPTLLEMCGIQRKPGIDCDGFSFLPALENKPYVRGPLFIHFPTYINLTHQVPATAVVDGDWKLIRNYFDSDDQTDRFELYNIKEDVGEQHNLANEMAQKVKHLNMLITRFLNNSGAVLPRPNPAYMRSNRSTSNTSVK